MSRDPFLAAAVLGAAAFAAGSAIVPDSPQERAIAGAAEIVRLQLGPLAFVQSAGARVAEVDGITAVCGRVSVLPRLDASRRFIAAGDAAVLEGEIDGPAFAEAWRSACGAGL